MSSGPSNHTLVRRGFSLAEAVVAMGVLSIILLGMGGAITLSVSAIDQGNDANAGTVKAAEASDRLLADLGEATKISSPDASTIEFEVPDRDGDGQPEVIAYTWTDGGSAGAPLRRSLNGDAPQVMMSRVRRLEVGLVPRRTLTATGAESRLIGFDTSVGATIRSQAIVAAGSAAQYAKPALPDNAAAWSITRVRLRLARDSTITGTLRVSLVMNNNWAPTGAVLSTVTVSEASLPATAGWVELPLTAGPLAPNQGVFLLLEDAAGSGSGTVEYGSGGAAMPYNTYFATSAGSSWTAPQDASDMRFEIYGTVSTY